MNALEAPIASSQSLNVRILQKGLADVIRDFFGNSYKKAISALVEENKVTADELEEILDLIKSKENEKNS